MQYMTNLFWFIKLKPMLGRKCVCRKMSLLSPFLEYNLYASRFLKTYQILIFFATDDDPTPTTQYEGMVHESSIDEPEIREMEPTHHDVTYTVVDGASKRGKTRLIDSQGHTYNVKRRRVNATDWQCSVRPKGNPCRATVKQNNNDIFERNTCSHNHAGEPGAITAAKIAVTVKKRQQMTCSNQHLLLLTKFSLMK